MQLEAPSVEFLILADHAEAINGKLYLMGGAWDRLYVADFQEPVSFSIALGLLVPWADANEDIPLRVTLESEDGTKIAPDLEASINVGRPPLAVRGQSFRALVAIQGKWKLSEPGTYLAIARLGEGSEKRATFYAIPAEKRTQMKVG